MHASLAEEELDLRRLAGAQALVANGEDDRNALFSLGAREQGFRGPIVALIDEPTRRAAMTLAGASAAFTPNHALAAVLAVRASARIGPRVAGVEPWATCWRWPRSGCTTPVPSQGRPWPAAR